jgi:dephospho-CoA kinase
MIISAVSRSEKAMKEETVSADVKSKPIVGLVGGMGSGKSRVAGAFLKHGAAIIAGDSLGHEGLEQPEILDKIAGRWGERVLNAQGAVDREKLGAIVFASPVERTNLEYLVFPWIEQRIRAQIAIANAESSVSFIVLDAAVMLEAGWNNECNWIVYVHAPRPMRLDRLAAQRGWTAEQVASRETVQMPLAVKAARADAAIDNSQSFENTQEQVDALVKKWGLYKAPTRN